MRYIGSKRLLLKQIENVINENIKSKCSIFCDIFSWTWIVSEFFKDRYIIISNDLLYFSFVIQRASVMGNIIPDFKKLKKFLKQDPFDYFNNIKITIDSLNDPPFIYNHYSPNKNSERMYLSNDNALKIDFIRQKLNEWKQNELLEDTEYYYLLACLICSVPSYSNIAWTYWAYLKKWDSRALKKLILEKIEIKDNNRNNICYNEDANTLIKSISWDILYIDPPYNTRQYLPNYHLLETIAKYDAPKVYWKTWMRPYKNVRSKYCIKKDVLNEFEDLIKFANFKHIIVSYNTEWIMKEEEILKTLEKYWKKEKLKIYKIPYRRYKHTKWTTNNNLEELLFYIEK